MQEMEDQQYQLYAASLPPVPDVRSSTEVNVTRAVLGFTSALPRVREFLNNRSHSVQMRAILAWGSRLT